MIFVFLFLDFLCGMRLKTDVKLWDFLILLFSMSLRIKIQAIKKEEYSIRKAAMKEGRDSDVIEALHRSLN